MFIVHKNWRNIKMMVINNVHIQFLYGGCVHLN